MTRLPHALVAALMLSSSLGWAQSVELQLSSNDVFAQLPFVLSVVAEGFDESPTPEAPTVEIPGCKVTFSGVSPSVRTSLQIINGRRSQTRRVTFVYRYQVEAPKSGRYRVEAVSIVQGSKRAQSRAGAFQVTDVPTSRDMQIRVNLPNRPVWLGETFEMTVDWFLRRDAEDQNFQVPLFDSDAMQVVPAKVDGRQTLPFTIGARQLDVPYVRSQAPMGGATFTRFRFHLLVTPNQAGVMELPAARVAALLKTGSGRDMFGFSVAKKKLFRAQDRPRKLEVRALPLEGRPPSFAGAVGTAFSIEVQASRTVVRVGDPVELQVTIRGNPPLEGLRLPRLDVDGGLSSDLFSVTDDELVGEPSEDGKGKLFRVIVRLKSDRAREVPRLAFSYFDATLSQYRTVRSEPVALSVQGSAIVGADDVVSHARRTTRGEHSPSANAAAREQSVGSGPSVALSLVGADLSLSDPAVTLRTELSVEEVLPVVYGLYGLPLLLLLVRLYRMRTRAQRGQDSAVRRALAQLEKEIQGSTRVPARDSAPRIAAALRALAKTIGRDGLSKTVALERLETEAFDPVGAEKPLKEDLRQEAGALARSWAKEHRTGTKQPTGSAAVALVFIWALTAAAWQARANSTEPAGLGAARQAYQRALAQKERGARTRAFARAETLYANVAAAVPGRPELLTDWGNAALGASDLGAAVLAYKKALAVDGTLERAHRNLSWARSRIPSWLPKPKEQGAGASLFFWQQTLTLASQNLVTAIAFAIMTLLMTPWGFGERHRKALRRLSLVPLVVWVVMSVALTLEQDHSNDGVVVSDASVLRSADSLGAPAALAKPMPAGAEVTVEQSRQSWRKVRLADGNAGWIPSDAVALVR